MSREDYEVEVIRAREERTSYSADYPASSGHHASWTNGAGLTPHVSISLSEEWAGTLYVEVRTEAGYTFARILPADAEALGVALIRAADGARRDARRQADLVRYQDEVIGEEVAGALGDYNDAVNALIRAADGAMAGDR